MRAGYQRSLLGTFCGQDQSGLEALRVGGQGQCQRATYRAQLPRQGKLAGKFIVGQPVAFDLPAGGQDAQGNGQIQPAGILGQISRGQIDGDALVVGEFEPGVLDGATHALPRLLDLHIGQPDQRKTW